jgi:hypothetical protein
VDRERGEAHGEERRAPQMISLFLLCVSRPPRAPLFIGGWGGQACPFPKAPKATKGEPRPSAKGWGQPLGRPKL